MYGGFAGERVWLDPAPVLCYMGRMDMIAPAIRPSTTPPDLEADVARVLEANDLAKPPAPLFQHLKKITQRHHQVARAIAMGLKNWEIAAATGYSEVRISILKSDPMMKELIKAYTAKQEQIVTSLHEKLVNISLDAADVLQDRLEDKPDEITINQAMAMIELTADRTGYGPASTQNHNHNIGVADRLEQARNRAKAQRQLELKASVENSNGT